MNNEVPPNWYPDPTGRHQSRWWNGTVWTEHVADDGVSVIDPLIAATATSSATPKEAQPVRHKSIDGVTTITSTDLVFEFNALARVARQSKRTVIPLNKITSYEVIPGTITYLTVTAEGWTSSPTLGQSAMAFALHPRHPHDDFIAALDAGISEEARTASRSSSGKGAHAISEAKAQQKADKQANRERRQDAAKARLAEMLAERRAKKTPPKPIWVALCFRDLTSDRPAEFGGSYTYLWTLPVPPVVGMRVWAPGIGGLQTTVVAAIGPGRVHDPLEPVARLVSADEMAAAEVKKAAMRAEQERLGRVWLDMARRAAGIPVPGRARRAVPEGFPEIAPIDGNASQEDANSYGRMWWRAYKQAEEHGLPADDVKKFSAIAHRWYSVRDKGGNL